MWRSTTADWTACWPCFRAEAHPPSRPAQVARRQIDASQGRPAVNAVEIECTCPVARSSAQRLRQSPAPASLRCAWPWRQAHRESVGSLTALLALWGIPTVKLDLHMTAHERHLFAEAEFAPNPRVGSQGHFWEEVMTHPTPPSASTCTRGMHPLPLCFERELANTPFQPS